MAERRIEYVKVGRLVRFEPRAVAEYIERNRVVPMNRARLHRYLREAVRCGGACPTGRSACRSVSKVCGAVRVSPSGW